MIEFLKEIRYPATFSTENNYNLHLENEKEKKLQFLLIYEISGFIQLISKTQIINK